MLCGGSGGGLGTDEADVSLLKDVSVVDTSCCLWVMVWLALGLATTVFKTSLHRISHGRGDGCGVVGIENHFARLLPDSCSKALVFRNLFSSLVLLRSLILICSSVSGSTSFGVCKSLLGVQTSQTMFYFRFYIYNFLCNTNCRLCLFPRLSLF